MRPWPVLALLSLTGCGACPFHSKCASGPWLDLESYEDEVAAIAGGTFQGTVEDGSPPDDPDFTPCPIAGQAWTLEMSVAGPHGCDRRWHDGETGNDCDRSHQGGFSWDGALAVGAEAPVPVEGAILASSEVGGLILDFDLDVTLGPWPWQVLSPLPWGGVIQDLEITGFSWERRLTEDDAEAVLWEVCEMPVSTHLP